MLEMYWLYNCELYRLKHICDKVKVKCKGKGKRQKDANNELLADYLIYYNNKRPHIALNLKTPLHAMQQNNKMSHMCLTYTKNSWYQYTDQELREKLVKMPQGEQFRSQDAYINLVFLINLMRGVEVSDKYAKIYDTNGERIIDDSTREKSYDKADIVRKIYEAPELERRVDEEARIAYKAMNTMQIFKAKKAIVATRKLLV
jgi:hypothetical protein